MKRITLWLSLTVLSCLLLGAVASASPVEIEFSGWPPSIIQGVIDRFNQDHPDIQVKLVPGGSSEILTRIAGGSPPDVYRVSWAEFGLWIRKNLALDLSRLIARDADEVQTSDIWPPALEAFQIGGKQWAMPHHIGGNLIYANLDKFAAAGVAAPEEGWTYRNDFANIARKLTVDKNNDGEVDQWGFGSPAHWGFWAGIIASNGGQVFDKETTSFTIDNAITRNAMKYVYDLVNVEKGAPGPAQRGSTAQMWSEGTAAMVLAPATKRWTDVDFGFKVVPNPQGTVKRVMPGGPQPLAIYPESQHIEEAWTFIKWVNRPDIQAWITNTLQLFPPSRRSAIPLVESPTIRTFGMELQNQLVYTNMLHGDIVRTFNGHLDKVLQDEEAIPAAATQIQHELDVRLQEALNE